MRDGRRLGEEEGLKEHHMQRALQKEEHFLGHRKAVSRKFTCLLEGALGWGHAGLHVKTNTQVGVS